MSLDSGRAVATLRSLTAKFDNAVEAAAPFYPELCTIFPSDRADEEYGILGAVPGVREWLGDRDFKTLRGAKFTISNREWENSVRIEKNDIDDDRLSIYGPVLEQLGVEAAYHPDELLFELIIAAESSAGLDSQYYFDTDHVHGDSGSQSNDLTYTAATGTTPTEAEFRGAYHAARAAMLGFKRDNGKLYHRPTIKPITDLLVVVPVALQETAVAALNKDLVNSGETNIVLDRPRIVSSAHLTDAAKFYLFRTGQPIKPFVFQARRPLARGMKGMDDREFHDVKFMTDARYNVGLLGWWNSVLTTFT